VTSAWDIFLSGTNKEVDAILGRGEVPTTDIQFLPPLGWIQDKDEKAL
jgi:hypothetical protein